MKNWFLNFWKCSFALFEILMTLVDFRLFQIVFIQFDSFSIHFHIVNYVIFRFCFVNIQKL